MGKLVFHLIGNAHIDPVWMWDWRDGLTTGLRTCRTILDLMEEYPELTFARGEAVLYEHIEQRDPATFKRIRERIEEGRWDIVGGQYLQPDNNMPSTRTALRQFAAGKEYFKKKFGKDIEIAWLADAFGHGRGTPEIFTAAGIKYFAMTRPQENICPIGSPLFRWQGQGGSELLCARMPSGAYASERKEDYGFFPTQVIEELAKHYACHPVRHLPLMYGLGDHGGGPTRHHLDALRKWKSEHDEVEVKFSTLTEFFREAENFRSSLPEFDGEINFCQRGCYSSTMKFKHLFRKAEARVERAAKVCFLTSSQQPEAETEKALAFNSFHDILPGTSIERAVLHQREWLGGAIHEARKKEFSALTALGQQIDTSVPPAPGYDLPEASPYIIFNPSGHEWKGIVDIDFELDSRPVWGYKDIDGRPPVEVRDCNGALLPFQLEAPENHSLTNIPPWRRRVLFEVTIPPSGWCTASAGYNPAAAVPPPFTGIPAEAAENFIRNGYYSVKAVPGEENIIISGKEGDIPVRFALFNDPTGSWGDMSELPENSHTLEEVERWKITETVITEKGPLRSAIWIKIEGRRSTLEITFKLSSGRNAVDMNVRCYWLDRGKRLKMLMPRGEWVDYDVPGGVMRRGECASVPGGRHQRVFRPDGASYALLSDTVYGYEHEGGYFAAVLARGCRWSTDVPAGENDFIQHPVADAGEILMNFVFAPFAAPVNTLAEELELPPVHWLESNHKGPLPRTGTCGLTLPEALKWIDAEPGFITLQNRSTETIQWRNTEFKPWKIVKVPCSVTDLHL